MSQSTVFKTVIKTLKSVYGSLTDVMPPYTLVEGNLDAKEVGPEGTCLILVSEEIIEVDQFTFDKLMEGEALRIQCTKSNRAISIDRLIS